MWVAGCRRASERMRGRGFGGEKPIGNQGVRSAHREERAAGPER